jgi:hypothetical protein
VIEQCAERLPEACDIGEQDRLLVPAELRPGHLLDDLFERADPAGQGNKGIRHFEHLALALVHIARDDQAVCAFIGVFTRHQKIRDDASDLAFVRKDGCGQFSHHADSTAAVDEADAVVGKDLAEGAGG